MSRRHRHRRGGNGNGGNGHGSAMVLLPHDLLTETLAPGYVPVRGDPSSILAPVLELDGLDPWDEIQGPSLVLEEAGEPEEWIAVCDDPSQLLLDPSLDATAEDGAPDFEAAVPEPPAAEPEAESFVTGAELTDAEVVAAVPDEPSPILDEAADLLAIEESEDDPALDSAGAQADGVELIEAALATPATGTAEADVEPYMEVAGLEAVADGDLDAALEDGRSEEPAPVDPPPGGEAAQAHAAEPEAPPAAPPPLPDPIEILYGQAHEAADAGRSEDAKRLYRELLAHHPAHVRARNNLALLLDAEGNHQAALAELDRALDIEPDNLTLLVNRGALLGAMGRYAAAERDLKKVLRLEPSHAEALFNLGVVMTKKGLWAEAVPHLKRAVELEPERGAAHFYLGEALNHVDDLAGALTAYLRATELQPANARALYGLGIIYDRLARPDDAALMYRRSREVGRR